MKSVAGSFGVTVDFQAETTPCVFTGAITVEQLRADEDPPVSADVAVTFDRTVYDAITARARWTASRLIFDGEEIVLGRTLGATFEESLTPAEGATCKFIPVGDRWAIPSTDFVKPDPSTCPQEVGESSSHSPRSWGNKPMEFYLSLGASPKGMKERKLFQGMSFQKANKASTQVLGEITGVDDSSNYANVPLCYSLPPFAGLRRDEIIRQMAANAGLDPRPPGSPALTTTDGVSGTTGQVICPILKLYTKPLLITNQSLLPLVNAFLAGDNGFAFFNADGNLEVVIVDVKDSPDLPDWTLDANLGDFDSDTLEEVPPTAAPTKIIAVVSQPVSGTGPDGSNQTVTTRTIEEEADLYAPQCVKTRPSGQPSFLYGDDSYRTLAAEQLMLVSRKITDVTTVNGQETRRAVTTFGFYNPAAKDPNFDTYPNGTSYNGAYGDHTFHRDEAESFMEISYDELQTLRDVYGTQIGTVETRKEWYAPHRGMTFIPASRTTILGKPSDDPPSCIYAGGTARTLAAEEYGIVSKVEKSYTYGADGTLASTTEDTAGWFSPDSRCDITVNDDDPTDQQPQDPPNDNQPPEPPPSGNPAWYPQISGPIGQDGGTFIFLVSIAGGPAGGPLTTEVTINGYLTGGSIPAHGGFGSAIAHSGNSQKVLLIPGSQETGYAKITFSGPKPGGTCYVQFSINRTGTTHGDSNNLIFDPWAGLPPGGSL